MEILILLAIIAVIYFCHRDNKKYSPQKPTVEVLDTLDQWKSYARRLENEVSILEAKLAATEMMCTIHKGAGENTATECDFIFANQPYWIVEASKRKYHHNWTYSMFLAHMNQHLGSELISLRMVSETMYDVI